MEKTTRAHWSKTQRQAVLDNIDRLSVEEIAAQVNRSPRAVRLFLHRHKITQSKTVKNNVTLSVLQRKFIHPEYFNPTKQFFIEVRINQKRWWDLYYGRKPITLDEYERLCAHLDIPAVDRFEAKQNDLFEPPYY